MTRSLPRFLSLAALSLFVGGVCQARTFKEPTGRLPEPKIAKDYGDYGGGLWWKETIDVPSAIFIRLRFDDLANPDNEQFEVVLRDREEGFLLRIPSTDFRGRSYLITPRLPTDAVTIRVEGRTKPKAVQFTLREYTFAKNDYPESLSIPDNRIPWTNAGDDNSPVVASSRDSIVLVYMESSKESCTGFLVSRRHILTNHHCLLSSASYLRDHSRCDDIRFEFNISGKPSAVGFLHCGAVLQDVDADNIDMALLEIRSADVPKTANRAPLSLVSVPSTLPRRVVALHHPAGVSLQVSRTCEISVSPTTNLVNHDCATIGGSSGAPLIDSQTGSIVGLHAFGFEDGLTKAELDRRTANRINVYNQAVEGSLIYQRIKQVTGP